MPLDDAEIIIFLKNKADDPGANLSEAERDELKRLAYRFERAFQMMEIYGVKREQVRTISNGIDVLIHRGKRSIESLQLQLRSLTNLIDELRRERTLLRDALRDAGVEIPKPTRQE